MTFVDGIDLGDPSDSAIRDLTAGRIRPSRSGEQRNSEEDLGLRA